MFSQKKNVLCVRFLWVIFIFVAAAWAERAPSDNAYPSTAPASTSHPVASSALTDVTAHDNLPGHDPTSSVQVEVTKVGAEPSSADANLPATLTVKTATLLELHEMRQSAVDLCLQLPKKYRNRMPQCAEIFKHEIRLENLAVHNR